MVTMTDLRLLREATVVNRDQMELVSLEDIGADLKEPGSSLILLNSDSWGPPDTGRKLMEGFLAALAEGAAGVAGLALVNRAVLLSQSGPALHSLGALQNQGVEIMLCSISIRDHGIAPTVGRQVTLFQLVSAILRARRVITI